MVHGQSVLGALWWTNAGSRIVVNGGGVVINKSIHRKGLTSWMFHKFLLLAWAQSNSWFLLHAWTYKQECIASVIWQSTVKRSYHLVHHSEWLSLLEAFHKQSFSAAGLVPTAATILLRSNALIWKQTLLKWLILWPRIEKLCSNCLLRQYPQLPSVQHWLKDYFNPVMQWLLSPVLKKLIMDWHSSLIFTDVSMVMEIASSKGRLHGGGGSHRSIFLADLTDQITFLLTCTNHQQESLN
jgi:hypothetical protein